MTTLTIDSVDADDLANNHDGTMIGAWCREADIRVDSGRWMEHRTLVLRHDDGTVWGLDYSRGLTENQEHEYPWRDADGPLPLARLWRTEEITVRYVTTEPDHSVPEHLRDRIYDVLLAALGGYGVMHCPVTDVGPSDGIQAADVEDIAGRVARAVRELTGGAR